MSKYIDPTYDVGFKLTFGRENQSEELLIGILNALLCNNDDYEEITGHSQNSVEAYARRMQMSPRTFL